jgi:hypothetical protein
MLLLEHPLSSYMQKITIALRENGIPFAVEISQDLGSGRSGCAFKATNRHSAMPILLTTKATDATKAHAAPDCPTPR